MNREKKDNHSLFKTLKKNRTSDRVRSRAAVDRYESTERGALITTTWRTSLGAAVASMTPNHAAEPIDKNNALMMYLSEWVGALVLFRKSKTRSIVFHLDRRKSDVAQCAAADTKSRASWRGSQENSMVITGRSRARASAKDSTHSPAMYRLHQSGYR